LKEKQVVKLLRIIAIFFSFFLFAQLANAEPNDPLINNPVPKFNLPLMSQPKQFFSQDKLRGHISLINIWSSYCSACRYEHELLMSIKKKHHIPMYGITFKDNSERTKRYLDKEGNPYVAVMMDDDGAVGDIFGIYGTPETYVVDEKGIIRYHFSGAMTEESWNEEVWPAIQALQKKSS
jgi:cytochrome c biogenesis protein CcmG/thiol:disulfide interchange protein DsbE